MIPLSASPFPPAPVEPVTVISDLHISHPVSLVRRPSQVAALLPDSGTVVFNGDSVEMRSAADRDKGARNRDILAAMCRERGVAAVFLTGNHDPYVSEYHYVELYGGKVLITHGDILFHGVSPWSHESRMIAVEHTRLLEGLAPQEMGDFDTRMDRVKRASRILEKFYTSKQSVFSVARNIALEFLPPWRPFSVLKYWRQAPVRAVEIADQFKPDARFVLIGHMHRAGIWELSGRVIVNTGCFFPFVGRTMLRIENGQVRVIAIERRGLGFHPGAVLKCWEVGEPLKAR